MVPIGSIATFEDRTGPYRVTRYNLFPAIEMDGEPAPGSSTGEAMEKMEQIAVDAPPGFRTEWTDIAYQQKAAGNTAGIVFGARGGVRLPRARRPVRKPGLADRGDPDRADDAAGGDGSA